MAGTRKRAASTKKAASSDESQPVDPPTPDRSDVRFLDHAGNVVTVTRVQFDRLYAPQGYSPLTSEED